MNIPMIHLRSFLILALLILSIRVAYSQDSLENLLDSQLEKQTDYTSATFKSTRILNGHSIERMKEGQLDFRIEHRFGQLNSGAYNLWGLDQANMHLSLEYGITNWLMVGVGRGTYHKAYDGFAKFSIWRQSTGNINMPVSVSYLSSIAINTLRNFITETPIYFSSRVSYVNQILVARKFNDQFSFELNPTMVHRNFVTTALDANDLYALGSGARFKVSKRISLNAEYYINIKPTNYHPSTPYYDPVALGVDIETGGHVFQLILTNSLSMIESGFIGETTGQWKKGDIYFGFNISRVFALKNRKKD